MKRLYVRGNRCDGLSMVAGGSLRLTVAVAAALFAGAGCRDLTATITFDGPSDGQLESVDGVLLTFDDPGGRMAERQIPRSKLPRSLDLVLPGGMTDVTVQVDACHGSDWLFTGGATLPVQRHMSITLAAAVPGQPCPSRDDGPGRQSRETPDAAVDADATPDAAADVTDADPIPDAAPDTPPCDDAAVDTGNCPNPGATFDGAVTPDAGVISAECVTYCDDMGRSCPGEYPGIAECQAYCALSGWAISDPDGVKNSLHCRQLNLAVVPTVSSNSRPLYCAASGPNGGGQGVICANTVCDALCDGWVRLCDPNATSNAACLATCSQAEASCRVKWLVLAASDRRYCEWATVGSHCGGCPPP